MVITHCSQSSVIVLWIVKHECQLPWYRLLFLANFSLPYQIKQHKQCHHLERILHGMNWVDGIYLAFNSYVKKLTG